jgi:hypothetical protein
MLSRKKVSFDEVPWGRKSRLYGRGWDLFTKLAYQYGKFGVGGGVCV